MSKLLLLPSAKIVPAELRAEFGPIPSAMIPLDSRPALHYIAEPYLKRGYEALVAVHESAELVTGYLQRNHTLAATAVDVGQTANLGSTVLRALDQWPHPITELVINFADTFVGDDLASGDVICYCEQDDLYRWTGFDFDETRRLTMIADKLSDNALDQAPVFVGVFQISDAAAFRTALAEALNAPQEQGADPFYSAIAAYFNALPEASRRLQRVEDWRDFGHLDTYYKSKRAFFLNRRYFNDVQVDAARGVVRKSSSNGQKLVQEIKWYLSLPKSLQYIAPRILDYGFLDGNPFVEMEFYGYPALNDVYLFGSLDSGAWRRVLDSLGHALEKMHEHRYQPASQHELSAAMESMYITKTAARLRPILDDPRFERFRSPELSINGTKCLGLERCLELLPEVADAVGLLDTPYFTVIHGDFCLSNILYDRRNSFVRLIDPRGEFGSVEVYGDFRYDLAKLCHSVQGDYDFFVNDLLTLEWAGDELRFHAHLGERHHTVKRLFDRWIKANWGQHYDQLKLIESLLFLSMAPLHADRFVSQQAFLGRGLELFSHAARHVLHQEVGAMAS